MKVSSDCKADEVLNASDHSGCICQNKTLADRLSCCKAFFSFFLAVVEYFFANGLTVEQLDTGPPKTASTGQGKCTSKYDGSEAECDLDCNSP